MTYVVIILAPHKINNKKCTTLQETMDFLNAEQLDKLKHALYKNKAKL